MTNHELSDLLLVVYGENPRQPEKGEFTRPIPSKELMEHLPHKTKERDMRKFGSGKKLFLIHLVLFNLWFLIKTWKWKIFNKQWLPKDPTNDS